MFTIEITFLNNLAPFQMRCLTWELYNHEAAFVWFKLLNQELKKNCSFQTRFSGFALSTKNKENLLSRLNHCIETINLDGRYQINEVATEFSQEFSNRIHHHFEILVGNFEKSSEYLLMSPKPVKVAVLGLNSIIHDLEALERNTEARKLNTEDHSFACMIFEIHNSKRYSIPNEYNNLFSPHIHFGDIVLHYSQIGKTWLEAFFDEDQKIFNEAILPHYALSGEFDIMFGQLTPESIDHKKLDAFLISKNQTPGDPALRLGHLPVAKLLPPIESHFSEFKDQLASYSKVSCIKTFSDKILLNELQILH